MGIIEVLTVLLLNIDNAMIEGLVCPLDLKSKSVQRRSSSFNNWNVHFLRPIDCVPDNVILVL